MLRRILGGVIFTLAIAIAVVPQLTKCLNPGMVCNYTAKAELALALPVLIEGMVLLAGVRGPHVGLALAGAGTGISVILVAYVIIGVCAPQMMPMECYLLMKPLLLITGLALVITNIILLGVGLRLSKA